MSDFFANIAAQSKTIDRLTIDEDEFEAAEREAAALFDSDDDEAAAAEQPQYDEVAVLPTPKKRKAPAGKLAATAAAAPPPKQKTPAVVVVPPKFSFDSVTLGGRPLDPNRKEFRAVFANSYVLGRLFGSIAAMASMFPLRVQPDGISVRLADATIVIYFIIKIPRTCFLAFENESAVDEVKVISSVAFQQRQSEFTNSMSMTLAYQSMPIDSATIAVQLYPASGDETEDVVTTFSIPVSDSDEFVVYDDPDDSNSYHFQITVSHALLMKQIKSFDKSNGVLALTVTNHSFDIAAMCDEKSKQTKQISFVAAADDSDESVEAALKLKPNACHCRVLQHSTREQPANVVNYGVALIYFRRALRSLVGCRYVRIAIGRDYARRQGNFTPMRFTGAYAGTSVAGSQPATMTIYIANRIETDN